MIHIVEHIIASYDLRIREKLQFCVQFFVADIEFQELISEGGKHGILYCDVTEAELQKSL